MESGATGGASAIPGIGERQRTEDGVVRQDGSEGRPQTTDSATDTAKFQPTQEAMHTATTEASQPATNETSHPATTEATHPATTEATNPATTEATHPATTEATHPAAAHEATPTESTSGDPSLPPSEKAPAGGTIQKGDLPQQPENQVVTRRAQFKTKKSRAENKKQAKATKAAAKQKKQEDRKKKRCAKETKKEEAAELRRQKKAQRDLEKEEKKMRKRQKIATAEPQNEEPKEDHGDDKKTPKTDTKNQASEVQPTGCCARSPENSRSSAKTPKLKKLTKLQKKLRRRKNRAKKIGNKHLGKHGAKQTDTHSGESPVEQVPSKRRSGGQSRPKPKKPSKATAPSKKEYVKLVTDVLQTCKSSNCTHPDWETPSFDKKSIQISTYWSRCAVGVKIKRQIGKKSQKGGGRFEQVAYFSCPSWCIYSNMAIAHVYVSYLVFFRAV